MKCYFEDELEGSKFRIYTLPYKGAPVSARQHIESDSDYQAMKYELETNEESTLKILVFRFEENSPSKIPLVWTDYKHPDHLQVPADAHDPDSGAHCL